jgi:hypothetical protein
MLELFSLQAAFKLRKEKIITLYCDAPMEFLPLGTHRRDMLFLKK